MIYLQLFWSFLQIGLFSFGGGYAALPLIQGQIVDRHGWLAMAEFTDLITISQMTPGPIAINAATFVGIKIAGPAGAAAATLGCVLPSCVIATVLGVALGVIVAIYRDTFLARFLMGFSLVGISLPTFLIGILFILVFSVWLGWLPSYGRGEVIELGGWSTGLLTADGWAHMILPALTLSVFQLALIMRLVRAEMLEVLRSDFIKFARARGLGERSIHFRHALKNTLIPVITIVGLQLGGIIAFSIVTETVFQWPGLGLLFIQAVQFADIPVMTCYLCLIALMFVLINFLVDWLYTVVDPRLKPGLSRSH